MRFSDPSSAKLLLAFTLLPSTLAIITGVTAPSTVYAYNPFNVTLTTSNYIQSVYDVAVAFGVANAPGFPGSLGSVVATAYLGPTKSNVLTPISFSVTLPSGTGNGPRVLSAEVFSLFGAAYSGVVTTFNTTINVAGF
ncbi:uncharacterized protein L3040_005093 [Drepanopeziza brunnea f. sp. 'multigermtubi']|uniref:Secreted protein NIS1 n=1 Tax=Marssonina brunnea f. sp. multigermtubi (strain MB_m1) TaxID=1072389 RepID=K1WLX5_MARBU|nr:uncharacterized protein MBM_08390 [Drepanopeziza brunnea f. sp. 'multigermtubi' MB_m1]EKD13307.1 hypothetical protein MBM_08390 [Drepanopeziza brunnea f. sp. 'multigermtubi' MB_m1]KAJ5041508.1 hypothetical protein L3040_005093 [Drepanopeziza brunnea f. sp. 'multigermtubi']